jgi:8-oxo-dGTP pyrophosphatase MutT (NUDIX family)
MEPTLAALTREIREELEAEAQVERLLWVAEEFFLAGGVPRHQLGFYYLISLAGRPDLYDLTRCFEANDGGVRVLFRWFPFAALAQLTLFPTFLARQIQSLPDSPRQLTVVDVAARPYVRLDPAESRAAW